MKTRTISCEFIVDGKTHYNLGEHRSNKTINTLGNNLWKAYWDTLCSIHYIGTAELIIRDETGEYKSHQQLNACRSLCMYRNWKPMPLYATSIE